MKKACDVPDIFDKLPTLKSDMEESVIKKYTSLGMSGITNEERRIITSMESQGRKFKVKVLCVIEAVIEFNHASVDTTNYVYLSNEFTPYEDNDSLIIYAKVFNKTWEFNEDGIIGLIEKDGLVMLKL